MALRLIRALPGERRCLPPSQGGPYHLLDATVAAPGPHDFAVRCGDFVGLTKASLTPQASIATRATFRDDREAPLMAARAEWINTAIQNSGKEKYFAIRPDLGLDS